MRKRKKPMFKYLLEEIVGEIMISDESSIIDYKIIVEKSLNNKEDYRIVFDTCRLDRVTMNGNVFVRSEFIDCVFTDCDLSNSQFINCTFIRCEFINTRLTGTHFVESFLSNVLIDKSHCNFVDFASSKLEVLELSNSLFHDGNFYENEVKQMTFSNLELQRTTFFETSLNDVDLSSCMLYEIKTDLKSIKGSVISSFQAREVCHLLGIKIND
jgi:uncharacterized protein YjbI with pentapeptide repeats